MGVDVNVVLGYGFMLSNNFQDVDEKIRKILCNKYNIETNDDDYDGLNNFIQDYFDCENLTILYDKYTYNTLFVNIQVKTLMNGSGVYEKYDKTIEKEVKITKRHKEIINEIYELLKQKFNLIDEIDYYLFTFNS